MPLDAAASFRPRPVAGTGWAKKMAAMSRAIQFDQECRKRKKDRGGEIPGVNCIAFTPLV